MILLKKIQLNDFLSHKNTEIDFRNEQKMLIDGNSGSGKSSIFESIIWALYGQGRSTNVSLVRRGAKKASVTLELTDDIKTYEIQRSVTAGGKHTLTVKENGIAHDLSGVKELQAWIEKKLIGASYLLFVNSIAYLQGGSETFVSQSAARRKELLLEIVKTDDFNIYYEKARVFITGREQLIAANGREIETTTLWINETEQKAAEKDDLIKKLEEIRRNLDDLQKKWSDLTQKEGEYKTIDARAETAKSIVEEYEKDVRELDLAIKRGLEDKRELSNMNALDAALGVIQAQIDTLKASISRNMSIIEDENNNSRKRSDMALKKPHVADRGEEIVRLKTDIEDLSTKPDCPSGVLCPYMAEKTSKIERLTAQIKELNDISTADSLKLHKWQDEYDKIPNNNIDNIVIKLNKDKRDVDDLMEERHKIEFKLNNREALRNSVESIPGIEVNRAKKILILNDAIKQRDEMVKLIDSGAVNRLRMEIQTVRGLMDTARNEESRFMADIKHIEKMESSIDSTKKQLKKLKNDNIKLTEEVRKLGLLKDAFGSRGIKTIVIDYLLPNLEEKINNILSQMSDFRVNLDTQQEKTSGEGNKEGLFIIIMNEIGEKMPFENYSGGEKLKIIVAISEALATLQKCGFRMFDETFFSLDENSLEGFMSVLGRLIDKFPQILCISHIQDIKEAFENNIIVTKHNGVSVVL